jgi:hypothetical protein
MRRLRSVSIPHCLRRLRLLLPAGRHKDIRARVLKHLLVQLLTWAFATTPVAADMRGRTYLTVEGAVGKKPLSGTPVLKAITARYGVLRKNGMRVDVMPEFHFVAPKGNAVRLHRELVETDSAITAASIRGATIRIPGGQQMVGATISGGWPCGPGRYHVTLRAWLEDTMGNSGNVLQYTIHCNELVMF